MINLPNVFTILRLILIFPINFFLYIGSKEIALSLIFVAWLTDLLDGYLARKLSEITNLGKTLDPIADKILIFSIVLFLIIKDFIPLWLGLLIIGRDIVILSAGFVVIYKFKYVIPSNWVGKISAFLIGLILVIILISEKPVFQKLSHYFLLLIIILSLLLYSNYYIINTKALIKKINNK